MTPEQIALVREVVAAVEHEPAFAERFYERLFIEAPETRAMFGDPVAQRAKLVTELRELVELIGDLPDLERRAGALGARHRGYGVRAADYRLARRLMLETLDEVLGDAFDSRRRMAWERATMLVTELMQSS